MNSIFNAIRNRQWTNFSTENGVVSSLGQPKVDLDTAANEPKLLKACRKYLVWFSWGMGELREQPIHEHTNRINGDAITTMLSQYAQPGDILLCGNGEISHAALIGNNNHLIHSLATSVSCRGLLKRFVDTIEATTGLDISAMNNDGIGVQHETASAYFDRIARNQVVILRPSRLDASAIQRGLSHVETLVGQPYDFDFAPDNQRYYCSEIIAEYLKMARPDKPFTLKASQIKSEVLGYPILERAALIDPVDFLSVAELSRVL